MAEPRTDRAAGRRKGARRKGPQAVDVSDQPWLTRLLAGQSDFAIIAHSRRWLVVTAVILAVCAVGLVARGVNLSIEFTGGTSFVVVDAQQEVDPDDLRDLALDVGADDAIAQVSEDADAVQARVDIAADEQAEVGGELERELTRVLAEATGVERQEVDISSVGPRWGQEITQQMLIALAVFLALLIVYISLRFDLVSASASVVTLLHDLAVTVGVYALLGFQLSPASVIALLTILGYSLYDTVVVFDRVAEESGAEPDDADAYARTANDALNAVLLRSLSTSASSLLPVGSLLFIGAQLLGADTLQDLAVALFVGMAVGTWSSIVVATPLLVRLRRVQIARAERRAAAG